MEHDTTTDNPGCFTTGMTISGPKPVWEWDMFGGRQLVITISDFCPEPSWRQRMMTRLLFGSKWKRTDD